MKLNVGDKVRVKTWDALAEGNEVSIVSKDQNHNCQKIKVWI